MSTTTIATSNHRPVSVHKFGGTSVGSAERIDAVAGIVLAELALGDVVVVCSAMEGTTDLLVGIVSSPGLIGAGARSTAIATIRALHLETLGSLGLSGDPAGDPAGGRVRSLLAELDAINGALAYLHRTPEALHDRAMSIGERLSVELVAGALRLRGRDAVAMGAETFLETTSAFGGADPATFRDDRRVRAALGRELEAGRIPVVTGFIGRGPDGDIRLLGRGGSDLSAALLASALDAHRLVIWTDVEGVFSCDPRLVPEAEHIAHLHYREAGEMAYFGSKVLHPRTMIPVIDKRIPVEVRSTLRPGGRSTRIDGTLGARQSRQVAVSVIRGVTLLSLEGAGMAGVVGVSARLFGALAGASVSVVMIEQGSSEASICFAVRDEDAATAAHAVREAFRLDVARGVIEQLAAKSGMAIVTVVGSGLRRRIGSLAAMTRALASAGVNIHAITQGSSELSISVAVDAGDARRAARAVHGASRPGADRSPGAAPGLAVALVGLGGVGRAVARQIASHTNHRIVALADSSGAIIDTLGIDPVRLETICRLKASGVAIAKQPDGSAVPVTGLLTLLCEDGAPGLTLVDCTAAPSMVEAARFAASRGVHVVTANKRIVAGDGAEYAALLEAVRKGRASLGVEATVGAGLPVAATIADLIGAGDEILRIEAALSGSVGFVLAELEAGNALGAIIARAIELGYAEPDPSDDLHGLDLGRKALILSRLAGFDTGELVEIEPVIAPGAEPDDADGPLRARLESARRSGKRLRYLASVAPGRRPAVSLREIDGSHPFFEVPPRRAAIAVWTRMQGEDPILITGPGAGADPTAGGVLADLGRIAGRVRGRAGL
jgi:aspartokinase/homoserine dehydrogenase 1